MPTPEHRQEFLRWRPQGKERMKGWFGLHYGRNPAYTGEMQGHTVAQFRRPLILKRGRNDKHPRDICPLRGKSSYGHLAGGHWGKEKEERIPGASGAHRVKEQSVFPCNRC